MNLSILQNVTADLIKTKPYIYAVVRNALPEDAFI